MGETIRLQSRHDGFEFTAYHAKPTDARRGGLVVIQEIFGVTADIREACDRYAADGYEAIAPSMFDRVKPGFEVEPDEAGFAAGRQGSAATPVDQAMGDIQAAIDALKGPVFLVGYCFGGFMGWMAAARCTGLSAVSGYYGRRIPEYITETPLCPIILHYGKTDPHIPLADAEAVSAAHPEVPVYLYDAGHGFCRRSSHDFDLESETLSRLRTLQLFHKAAGAKGEMGG